MRVFIVTFALCFALVAGAAAQQTNSSNDRTQGKENKNTEQAAKPQEKKPSQATEKATEPGSASEEQKPVAAKPGADKDKEEFDVSEVPPIVTHHQLTLDGKLLKYTATAGRLPIKRGDGKIEAEMFFVAYTLDGQDAGKRPLTFAFNGGPGSATIWLHMGALGPKRVVDATGWLAAARALSHCRQPLHHSRQERCGVCGRHLQPASAAPPMRSSPRNSGV